MLTAYEMHVTVVGSFCDRTVIVVRV